MKNKGMELYAIVCGFMPLPYIRMVFFQTGKSGTVPDLGDLTTDEYSFVGKRITSRHLPVRRKNSSAL